MNIQEANFADEGQSPDDQQTVLDREPVEVLAELPAKVQSVQKEIRKCVVGQQATVDAALYAVLSRGHCLIEGVPGLGKTLLVRALARVLDLAFKRVQFTPDLMPADITGTVILQKDPRGQRKFVFARGPVFTQMLLADEINRTPPKTQAALLESMQEKTVTVSGRTHELEEPFFVLATENPIEQEGTYPLPEAQLDRFLFQILIRYPTLDQEREIIQRHSFTPLEGLNAVIGRAEVLAFREAVSRVPAAPNVVDYAARIVRATRPDSAEASESVTRWVRWGASPRASQNLILAGRARAACQGRFNVACDDVAELAPLVLRHRISRSFHADADGVSTDDIVSRILQDVPRDGEL